MLRGGIIPDLYNEQLLLVLNNGFNSILMKKKKHNDNISGNSH